MNSNRTRRIRPCRICGLAPNIRLSEEHGQYCLYYGVRITPEEAGNPQSILRRRCIEDGNLFVWPLRGLTPIQLLDWRRQQADWRLKRLSLKSAMIIGGISVLLTLAGLLIANV